MTPRQVSQLVADISAAEDGAEAVALWRQCQEQLDTLPPREREWVSELIADAIKEKT